MKYPKYRGRQDLRKKIISSDIRKIRKMARKGVSRNEIAKTFNVSRETIWSYLLSKKEKLEYLERKRFEAQRHRGKVDPVLLKKINREALKKWATRKRKIQKAYREYQKFENKNFLFKNPEKRREYYENWFKRWGNIYNAKRRIRKNL